MRKLIIGAGVVVALAGGAWGLWRLGAGQVEAAMDARVAALAEHGVLLRWQQRRVEGFPFAYTVALEGVAVAARDGAWSYSTPWTRSTAQLVGAETVVTTAAPEGRLDVTAPQGAVRLRAETEGLRIETPLSEGPSTLTAGALRLIQPGSDNQPQSELALETVSARLAPDGATAEGSASLVQTLVEGGPDKGGALSRLTGLTVQASTQGPGQRLVAPGAPREIVVAATGSESAGPDAATGGSGPISLTRAQNQQRTRYDLRLQALKTAEGAGADAPGGVVDLTTLSMDIPAAAQDGAQKVTLEASLNGVSPNAALWRALDPGETLDRTPGSLKLSLLGEGDFPLQPDGRLGGALAELQIERFLAQGLGAQISVTGKLAQPAGASSPSGALSIAATGWEPALSALEKAGIAPPAPAALLRALAERLNAPDTPEGAFFSEIELRGGMVLANGVRVR